MRITQADAAYPAAQHALIRGLLMELPDLSTDGWSVRGEWNEADMRVWIEAAEAALRVLYEIARAE